MFPQSIRWKIQAWHGLLLLCLVSALIVGFYTYESRARLGELDTQLHEIVTPLLPRLTRAGPGPQRPGEEFRDPPGEDERRGPPPDDFGPPISGGGPPPRRDGLQGNGDPVFARVENGGFYYVAWSPEQQVTAQSAKAPKDIPYPKPSGFSLDSSLRTRGEFRELIHQVPNGYSVLVGKSTRDLRPHLRRLAFGLAGGGLAVVAIGLAGGWWLASRALRPIAAISHAAKNISGGDLSRRIDVPETESELGQLAGVLNQTFERLEKSFEQQVRFTADASHELRTPISVILTQTQLALSRERSPEEYRQTLETCERATERMRVLVNQLLELARADSGEDTLVRESCDLARIAREALEFIEPLAEKRKVTLQPSLESVRVKADVMKLGQVLINLLNNAIHHNREGIEVSLSVQRNGTHAIVRVADNGLGIPTQALPHLFDRFYRVDKSRSRGKGNSGLGLAISKAIVEAHGGTIHAQSEPGKGVEFIIQLPLQTERLPG
jgi:two-component system OmpR family sensor kinase